MRPQGPALVALLAFASLSAACERLPGRPDEADRYRRPSEILDFDSLYAAHCSGCHGAEGLKGPARPLADSVYLALVDQDRVRRIVANGIPGTSMPAFALSQGGTLRDAQLDAIATGIFERWAAPVPVPLPPYEAALGSPDRGAAAYATFCADCHGADGAGGKDGASVVDPNFLALVSDQMLRTSVIAGRPDLGMPDWREASKQRAMSPEEISDVVAWLAAKRVAAPPAGP
jgi:mono/diheme cytochrome c family protein